MKALRYRLLWMLAAVAILPLALVGAFSYRIIIQETESQNEERFRRSVDAAQARLGDHLRITREALDRLCEPDPFIDALLVDLATGRFPTRQSWYVSQGPKEMRARGLSVLDIIDAQTGERLVTGHYPGLAGSTAPEHTRRSHHEAAFVESVRFRSDDETQERPAVLFGCTVATEGRRLGIVGGRLLTESYIEELIGFVDGVSLTLEPIDASPPTSEGALRSEVHRFEDSDGNGALVIVATLLDQSLREKRGELLTALGVATSVTFLGVLVLGWVLSSRIRTPLRRLEDAAERVGEGDLDFKVKVTVDDEVGKSLHAFNAMTRKLRAAQRRLLRAEKIAAWREIARRIAHEIKNPLSPIQVSIETMRKTYAKKHPDFDEIFEESTIAILEEVNRMKHIVSEFSEFARMPRPEVTELNLADTINHVINLHTGEEVMLDWDGRSGSYPLIADREQLTQVLLNLIQNGIDAARARHGDHGGKVSIRIEARTSEDEIDGWLITIADNGPGIPPEDRERIFEPYFTTKATGTGLGLAISNRIVGDHGGFLDVFASESGGAEFHIWLPKGGPPALDQSSMTDASMSFVRRTLGDP